METRINRQWRLAARPEGMVGEEHFRWVEEQAPRVERDGQVLVRTLYLSCDPTQRGWMARDTYLPAVAIGEVMRSFGVGSVVESRHPDYWEGQLVQGLLGWQDYALLDGDSARLSVVPEGVPIPIAMSALGITGLTAYFGLLEIGRPEAGETVVVSGAAGATGSVVGQIARLKGCRVVGIAGGPEKHRWLVDEARFDAAIDYRREDVAARLAELCPDGIDIYFDNVGGEILDAALARLAFKGRVVLCGAIADYNRSELGPGPRNYLNLLLQRGRMEGFIILDFLERAGEAVAELRRWVEAGEIKVEVDVQEGLENAPRTLRRLFTGANRGKQLLRIA
ncbi:MAG: NADP-dependent oxidoreductase [Holophagae bacterium]|nr:MAG: NADP-dependent oxidoreductase [Holophagae bacterium]